MGKINSRAKGHSFERQCASILKPVFPKACRKLEYQFQSCTGVDLENTGAFKIQCKRAKGSIPISKIEEIKEPGIPVLISKSDRKPAYVTLPLEDFVRLLEDVGLAFSEHHG